MHEHLLCLYSFIPGTRRAFPPHKEVYSYTDCLGFRDITKLSHWFLLDNDQGRDLAGQMIIDGVIATPVFIQPGLTYTLPEGNGHTMFAVFNFIPGPDSAIINNERDLNRQVRIHYPVEPIRRKR